MQNENLLPIHPIQPFESLRHTSKVYKPIGVSISKAIRSLPFNHDEHVTRDVLAEAKERWVKRLSLASSLSSDFTSLSTQNNSRINCSDDHSGSGSNGSVGYSNCRNNQLYVSKAKVYKSKDSPLFNDYEMKTPLRSNLNHGNENKNEEKEKDYRDNFEYSTSSRGILAEWLAESGYYDPNIYNNNFYYDLNNNPTSNYNFDNIASDFYSNNDINNIDSSSSFAIDHFQQQQHNDENGHVSHEYNDSDEDDDENDRDEDGSDDDDDREVESVEYDNNNNNDNDNDNDNSEYMSGDGNYYMRNNDTKDYNPYQPNTHNPSHNLTQASQYYNAIQNKKHNSQFNHHDNHNYLHSATTHPFILQPQGISDYHYRHHHPQQQQHRQPHSSFDTAINILSDKNANNNNNNRTPQQMSAMFSSQQPAISNNNNNNNYNYNYNSSNRHDHYRQLSPAKFHHSNFANPVRSKSITKEDTNNNNQFHFTRFKTLPSNSSSLKRKNLVRFSNEQISNKKNRK